MASGKKYDVFHSVTSNDYYFIPNTCSGTVILCEACHKPYAWLGLACSVYYSVHLPSKLAVGANLHCFKNKIEPKWKDRVYAHGGEWTVTFSDHGKSDICWLYTFLVRAKRGGVIRGKDEWDRINVGSCGDEGGWGLGYERCRPPFTAVQWQELEHQAMIYQYLVAGLPVPPDLVIPIRHRFEAISVRFFDHPSCNNLSFRLSIYYARTHILTAEELARGSNWS
ncbi:Growth-regulating factor [Forsythia ovata]|uniref:Growth-regulating factor n=1 Tax=Forsythia ovata TaxID=205694 RepID=A0ABD1S5Q3_9LAMI